jgi:hypothetical protein
MTKETLHVVVHYPAAKEPFKDDNASPSETVGSLKARVLIAFGLSEGQQGNDVFTYTLYYHKTPLENLTEALGQVAGSQPTLQLKLSQQITQG